MILEAIGNWDVDILTGDIVEIGIVDRYGNVTIKDTGAKIPYELLYKYFQPFEKGGHQ